jgi:hypothetical protein
MGGTVMDIRIVTVLVRSSVQPVPPPVRIHNVGHDGDAREVKQS